MFKWVNTFESLFTTDLMLSVVEIVYSPVISSYFDTINTKITHCVDT